MSFASELYFCAAFRGEISMHALKPASFFAGICLILSACSGRYRIEGTVDTIGYEGHMMKVKQFTESGAVTYDSCAVNHG